MTRPTGAHWRRTSDAWKNWRDGARHSRPRSRRRGVWWRRRFRARAGDEPGWPGGRRDLDSGCTPQNPLIPGNTNEVCGGNIVGRHDVEAGALQHRERPLRSWTSPSRSRARTTRPSPSSSSRATSSRTAPRSRPRTSSTPGTTPRTAPTASLHAYFFAPIAGYDDVQCGTDAGKRLRGQAGEGQGPCAVSRWSTTTPSPSRPPSKVSNLPVRLGYTAFAPLPDSFFADPKAYGEKPIGAGPFKLDSKTDTEMVISKFADYSGKYKPNVDKVTFRIYQDAGAAYNDVVAEQPRLHRRRTSRPTGSSATCTRANCPTATVPADSGTIATTTFSPKTTISRTSRCARPSRWRSTGT